MNQHIPYQKIRFLFSFQTVMDVPGDPNPGTSIPPWRSTAPDPQTISHFHL